MTRLSTVLILMLATTSACASATQQDADLNWQTRQAGARIETEAQAGKAALTEAVQAGRVAPDAVAPAMQSLSTISVAGADVRDNADTLQQLVFEPPSDPTEAYSPEASAARRQGAVNADRTPGFIGWLADVGETFGIGWLAGIPPLLWGLWTALKKKQTDKKLMGTWEGIQQFKKAVASEDASMIDKLHAGLRTGQSLYGVWQDVAPELKRLKDLGKLSQDPDRPAPAPTSPPPA